MRNLDDFPCLKNLSSLYFNGTTGLISYLLRPLPQLKRLSPRKVVTLRLTLSSNQILFVILSFPHFSLRFQHTNHSTHLPHIVCWLGQNTSHDVMLIYLNALVSYRHSSLHRLVPFWKPHPKRLAFKGINCLLSSVDFLSVRMFISHFSTKRCQRDKLTNWFPTLQCFKHSQTLHVTALLAI